MSRDTILAALRGASVPAVPAPEHPAPVVPPTAPRDRFARMLEAAGGRCVAGDDATLRAALEGTPEIARAQRVASHMPDLLRGDVDLAAVRDPHALADLDVSVLEGELAVAENGAVFLRPTPIERAAHFLSEHAVLVVPEALLVDDLHAAYERLAFGGPGFGLFVAGPSKTADIEQSLVIGAHGPRSLLVLLREPRSQELAR